MKKLDKPMHRRRVSALMPIAAIAFAAACSQPAPNEAGATIAQGAPSPEEEQDSKVAGDAPSAGNSAANQSNATSAREVPLTPGIYVVQGESCRNPANAVWRGWDGDGLVGSSTSNCSATVVSRSGDDYRLRNSCENTYNGSRSDETFTMSVTDQVHFTLNDQRFAPCSTAQVPAAIRNHVFGRVTADTPINSENYADVMEARSREYDRLEYKPVNLSGFECGDNCYLELTEAIEGAAPRKVLCTARLCANWQGEGRLPPPLKNTGAKAKFGKANQVDGAGNIMARNVEAVVDLRL
jgi:hypothetical protein